MHRAHGVTSSLRAESRRPGRRGRAATSGAAASPRRAARSGWPPAGSPSPRWRASAARIPSNALLADPAGGLEALDLHRVGAVVAAALARRRDAGDARARRSRSRPLKPIACARRWQAQRGRRPSPAATRSGSRRGAAAPSRIDQQVLGRIAYRRRPALRALAGRRGRDQRAATRGASSSRRSGPRTSDLRCPPRRAAPARRGSRRALRAQRLRDRRAPRPASRSTRGPRTHADVDAVRAQHLDRVAADLAARCAAT